MSTVLVILVAFVAGLLAGAVSWWVGWQLGYREAQRRYVKASRHPTVHYVQRDEDR